jgi:MFS family permease
MDRFGRKITILMGALICLVGAILQTAAQNLAMILVGRILTGVSSFQLERSFLSMLLLSEST